MEYTFIVGRYTRKKDKCFVSFLPTNKMLTYKIDLPKSLAWWYSILASISRSVEVTLILDLNG